MNSKVRFKDKLRDRGFVDQWGFMLFATTGFIGIVIAKWLGSPTSWVAAGAVGAMFVYAIVIGRAGTGRLRADQAGDNCYYLGLIYTLASLSYAIASFDPGNTAATIVQGFGIALATTIVGLILRVFFNQGRPDLENHEEQIRLELTEASNRLKGEVNSIVVSMNDTSRMLGQSMEELHRAATASIERFAETTVEQIGTVVEEASAAIRSEANDFAARSKRYSTSFDKLLAKLEEQSTVVEQISRAHDALLGTVDASVRATTSAAAAANSLSEGAASAKATAEAVRLSVDSLNDLTTQLNAATKGLEAGVVAFGDEVRMRLEELRQHPTEAISSALAALAETATAVSRRVEEAEELHSRVHTDLVARNQSALAIASRHSQALENELERSRSLVAKVHSSLADMTGSLATELETRRP